MFFFGGGGIVPCFPSILTLPFSKKEQMVPVTEICQTTLLMVFVVYGQVQN